MDVHSGYEGGCNTSRNWLHESGGQYVDVRSGSEGWCHTSRNRQHESSGQYVDVHAGCEGWCHTSNWQPESGGQYVDVHSCYEGWCHTSTHWQHASGSCHTGSWRHAANGENTRAPAMSKASQKRKDRKTSKQVQKLTMGAAAPGYVPNPLRQEGGRKARKLRSDARRLADAMMVEPPDWAMRRLSGRQPSHWAKAMSQAIARQSLGPHYPEI